MKTVAHFNTYLSARLIGILMRVHMHMYKSEIDFRRAFQRYLRSVYPAGSSASIALDLLTKTTTCFHNHNPQV